MVKEKKIRTRASFGLGVVGGRKDNIFGKNMLFSNRCHCYSIQNSGN